MNPTPSMTETSTPTPPTRLTGSVRKLKGGYGFIAGDDGQDYFFHWSAMDEDTLDFRELSVRKRVSFELVHGQKGIRAVGVRVV